MAAIRRVFAINGVVVDLDRNTATFDGSEIRIEPKIAALLQYFIDHQGETLTREALIAAVWDGAYGADHSLTNAVSQLRKLLDRSGTGEKTIETVPKRDTGSSAFSTKPPTPLSTTPAMKPSRIIEGPTRQARSPPAPVRAVPALDLTVASAPRRAAGSAPSSPSPS